MYLDSASLRKLFKEIATAGRKNPPHPWLHGVCPFRDFFDANGGLKEAHALDDGVPHRELLTRYLLLNSVLDQGPDMLGVRLLLSRVTNRLYAEGIRFLHRPQAFFDNIERVVYHILKQHDRVKNIRKPWAQENLKNPNSYNLFIGGTRQVVDYAVTRWGVPLAVFLLNEREGGWFVDYFESFKTAEGAARRIKSDRRYGLGKTIGDKAFHLFMKWMLHTYRLVNKNDPYWSGLSYEVPFDSNAGRVLFRTGVVLSLLDEEPLYKGRQLVLREEDDESKFIWVTHLRGRKSGNIDEILPWYQRVVIERMQPQAEAKHVEFQRVPNAILFQIAKEENEEFSIGEFDDGLMLIGTQHCHNRRTPNCVTCVVQQICYGTTHRQDWLTHYHT